MSESTNWEEGSGPLCRVYLLQILSGGRMHHLDAIDDLFELCCVWSLCSSKEKAVQRVGEPSLNVFHDVIDAEGVMSVCENGIQPEVDVLFPVAQHDESIPVVLEVKGQCRLEEKPPPRK